VGYSQFTLIWETYSHVLTKLTRIGIAIALVLAAPALASAETTATPKPKTVAQASATPKPKADPKAFTYGGYLRAYDFYRQNAYGGHSAANQNSFSAAISLHGDYTFLGSGFDVGASYFYANPFTSRCVYATAHFAPPCANNKPPSFNPDDTLPGFELSTLDEAYLQYKAHGLYGKVGDQVINTPWAPSSDSRLKPAAFEGADVAYTFANAFSIEASDYLQWECRTCSDFDKGTLLTTAPFGYSGANALPANNHDPSHTTLATNGFFYGRLGYGGTKVLPLAANVYYYSFQNIANVIWADAKYTLPIPLSSFIALQGGGESNTGQSYLGDISSSVIGAQVGFSPISNVTFTGSYDNIPVKTATVVLPSGFSCTKTHTIKSPSGWNGSLPYFLPSGGTGNCSPGTNGTTNVYYGGWASPYSDSYATDPLFSTSLTQGMVDRRSPGTGFKVAMTVTTDDRRFVGMISQAWYDYNNDAYAQSTKETDLDFWYHFNPVAKSGPYKGFSLRYRYGSRDESPAFTGFGGAALFKYNRFQAEYDF
jgi:hypothetical protein